ncbi:winged helix-turn-helix transcriptional regulator [Halomarina pelagica]|uniref:winged helix-turn-helix transcriptional regulator n=1 Tax=Halomarina pelagica TaxID=2961599 RepID=UPI0020C3B442|nr:winged helix-turn-helix transcriptional regulator [Halomarina sp. BND7]
MNDLRRRTTPIADRELSNAVYRLTPAGTQEVADLVGISRQGVTYRLRQLEEQELIWSKKVGPTRVWIHPQVMKRP